MPVQPDQCLVIEDSSPGVMAGVAAGMTVLGFTGATQILSHMSQLSNWLTKY